MSAKATRKFNFVYTFNGSEWCVEIWAASPEEVVQKFEQLKATGKYEYEIMGEVYAGLDLELVETDRLIAELLKRFDSAVFAGSSFEPIEKGSEKCISQETRRYYGNARVCQGLAFGVIDHINRKRNEVAQDQEAP